MEKKEGKRPRGRPEKLLPDERKRSESVSINAITKRKIKHRFGSLGAALTKMAEPLPDPEEENPTPGQ